MPRPILATIDLNAFRHNYLLAKSRAPLARCFAVLKANGYGHGAVRCAKAVEDVADAYAVLDFAEALSLRESGIRQPILMLEGPFEPADLAVAQQQALMLVIHSDEQLRMIETCKAAVPVDVFLKMNSGMNRLGFSPERYRAALERLQRSGLAGQIVLMSHFANADADGTDEQIACFENAVSSLPPQAQAYPRSLCNSAGILRYAQAHGAWIRPGIMLYGGSPMPAVKSARQIGLRPVMQLHAQLMSVQTLHPGMSVGYGSLFTAERELRVGIVACGYADGYPRHAPTGTPIAVDGQLTRTLGRVSMDMLACDLSHIPSAAIGSTVELWGEGVAADAVASAAGTISYELFCGLAQRVPIKIVSIASSARGPDSDG